MTTTVNKIAALEAEQQRLKRSIERQKKKLWSDERRVHQIRNEIHDEQMKALVGIRHAVKRRARDTQHYPELNDALGTITKVRRTRCDVCFTLAGGKEEIFDFPLNNITAANAEQGETVYL